MEKRLSLIDNHRFGCVFVYFCSFLVCFQANPIDFCSRFAEVLADALPAFSLDVVLLVFHYGKSGVSSWALAMDEESIKSMLWALGEFGCRAHPPFNLQDTQQWANPRCLNGLRTLYVLGLQGYMPYEQLSGYIHHHSRDITCPPEHLRPSADVLQRLDRCARTITSSESLEAVASDKDKLQFGKYTRWWKGDMRVVKGIMYCVGQITLELWSEEKFSDNQMHYINALLELHEHPRPFSKMALSVHETFQRAEEDFQAALLYHPATASTRSGVDVASDSGKPGKGCSIV